MNKKIKADISTTEPKKDSSVKKESAPHKTKQTHTKTDKSTALEVEEHSSELVPLSEQSVEQKEPTPEKTPSIEEKPAPSPAETVTTIEEKKEEETKKEMPTPVAAPPAEPAKSSEESLETDKEIAEKLHAQATLKEKLIDRQLEMLWANGRKQLLNQPPQLKTMPLYPDNSPSMQAPHKPIKQ